MQKFNPWCYAWKQQPITLRCLRQKWCYFVQLRQHILHNRQDENATRHLHILYSAANQTRTDIYTVCGGIVHTKYIVCDCDFDCIISFVVSSVPASWRLESAWSWSSVQHAQRCELREVFFFRRRNSIQFFSKIVLLFLCLQGTTRNGIIGDIPVESRKVFNTTTTHLLYQDGASTWKRDDTDCDIYLPPTTSIFDGDDRVSYGNDKVALSTQFSLASESHTIANMTYKHSTQHAYDMFAGHSTAQPQNICVPSSFSCETVNSDNDITPT